MIFNSTKKVRKYIPRSHEATARRQLAGLRNWKIVQIKGCCGVLRSICYQYGRSGIARQLELFEDQLITNVKERYIKDKANLCENP